MMGVSVNSDGYVFDYIVLGTISFPLNGYVTQNSGILINDSLIEREKLANNIFKEKEN